MSKDTRKNVNKSKMPFLKQSFVSLGVALNAMGHGCLVAFPAVLNPSLRSPESHFHPTHVEESWIASIVGVALIFGNVLTTFIFDSLGRKKSHLITLVPILAGWLALIFAESVTQIIVARFFQGISMGMHGALGGIIIGEMTHPKNRGSFMSLMAIAMTLGGLFTHTVGSLVSWRYTALICSFTGFTSLIIIIYSPESPSWLISKGRLDESRKVFFWLRGNTLESIEELEVMIKAQTALRKQSSADIKLPFTARAGGALKYFRQVVVKPEFYKPIIIMAHLYIIFQFSGLSVLTAYMTDVISQLCGKEVNASFWMIALDIQRLLGSVMALYLVKRFKRRTLLFSSSFFCVATYLLKGLYLYLKQKSLLTFDSPWISISLISVYILSVSLGLSVVPFAIGGELFPLEYKNLGSGISVLSLSLNFFLAMKCFPMLIHSVGLPLTYVIYAAIVGFSSLVLYFMLPETSGKTLQEIEDGFRGVQRDAQTRALEPLNKIEQNC